MRTQPTSYSATTIEDSGFINGAPGQPGTGLTPNGEVGVLILILSGTGAGQIRSATANTTTVYTTDSPWAIIPDATSTFIVLYPQTPYTQSSPSLSTAIPPFQVFSFTLQNQKAATYFVQMFTSDSAGNLSDPLYTPFREIYMWGSAGSTGQNTVQIAF
jgi:hypothetical protein